MPSHAHHTMLVTRGTDPQIVELRAELSGLKDLIAEKDKSAARERADQKEARDKAEEAVSARLASLNALKVQRGEDRATFATREAMEVRLDALDKLLVQSREDRAAIHLRLDALAGLEAKVDTNTGEVNTVRGHVHDISGQVQALELKPSQFTPDEARDFRRLLTLALKFEMDDGFKPHEMKWLHEVAEWWSVRKQTSATRSVELWKAGLALIATAIVFHILPNIGHAIHALSGV